MQIIYAKHPNKKVKKDYVPYQGEQVHVQIDKKTGGVVLLDAFWQA